MIGLKTYIAEVESWLARISKANGYQTDLGTTVSSERKAGNGDDREMVTSVLLEGLESVRKTPQRRDWGFDLVVDVRVPTKSRTSEADTADVVEDVVRAIPTKTTASPEGLQTMEVTKVEVLRQPDGINFNVVGVYLRGTCFEFTNKPA